MKESPYVKIMVSVPVPQADEVRAAMGRAGAGKQGEYEYCSASYRVIGRFLPLAGANPAIGTVGEMEEVEEEMITTICHKDILAAVIREIQRVHPYEEPAIDILPRFEIE